MVGRKLSQLMIFSRSRQSPSSLSFCHLFSSANRESIRPISNCHFEDCEVESGILALCEYLVSMEVYKTEEVNNLDYASCSFDWDDVAIEIGSFELEVSEYDD